MLHFQLMDLQSEPGAVQLSATSEALLRARPADDNETGEITPGQYCNDMTNLKGAKLVSVNAP
jgi:hypothetical protein